MHHLGHNKKVPPQMSWRNNTSLHFYKMISPLLSTPGKTCWTLEEGGKVLSGTLVETPQAMVAVWGSVGALLCCLLLLFAALLFAAGALLLVPPRR